MHIRTYTSTMNIWNEGLLMHHCFSMRTVNSHKNTFSGFLGKCVYSTPCKKDVIYPTKRLPNPPNSKPINILSNPKTLSFVIHPYMLSHQFGDIFIWQFLEKTATLFWVLLIVSKRSCELTVIAFYSYIHSLRHKGSYCIEIYNNNALSYAINGQDHVSSSKVT